MKSRSLSLSKNLFFCVVLLIWIAGCSLGKVGQVVAVWDYENAVMGEIYPVYNVSKLNQTYLVKIGRKKVEMPMTKMRFFEQKKEAEAFRSMLVENKNLYLRANSDGTPMREQPTSESRRIYRLRKDQLVKVLKKETGVVTIQKMEGSWYYVATDDGFYGYCFDYNFVLVDKGKASSIKKSGAAGIDFFEELFSQPLYPQSFEKMIANGQVDLSRIKKNSGISLSKKTGEVFIQNEDFSISMPLTEPSQLSENHYLFPEKNVTISIIDEKTVGVRLRYEGNEYNANFVLIENIDEIIEKETERRKTVLEAFINGKTQLASESYGKLTFTGGANFEWRNSAAYSALGIPEIYPGTGQIQFKYFLDKTLASHFDGVVTFNYSVNTQSFDVNLFYNVSASGVKFTTGVQTNSKNSMVTAKAGTPLVLFFRNN